MGPFVSDRLHYFVSRIADYDFLGGYSGQRGTETANIFGKEVWRVSGTGTARGLVEEASESEEILSRARMIKHRDVHRRLLRIRLL